ncbi:LysR family transcriptional regulator [Pelagibius sp. Alg239-R121]|uniref:LysR family transcriptional regulator n=1 Tax=Pelagibius sp. Alg239-R121 TaxID=2993448 RepID=UPI0024A75FCE|nr:LysR family transcriptional regulator [Pelagibius sp. Alg239-R121]
MIDDLRAIAIFAESIRQGSFRGAAKKLKLSPSVVSYHVSELEKSVGTALIYRSTRKLSLTHEGQRLYGHALNMLTSAEQGLSEIFSNGNELRGKLTIAATSALMRSPLNEQIAAFHKLHPKVVLNISYSDIRQDLIAGGIDLAVRAGQMEDSSLKTRRIGQIQRRLVCTPAYINGRTSPKRPQDLETWNWIRLEMMPGFRTLRKPGRPPVQVRQNGSICVDSAEAMTQLCLQGLGLATPPDYLVDREIAAGALIAVLPDWSVDPMPLYAVWPDNVAANNNTKALVEYLTKN